MAKPITSSIKAGFFFHKNDPQIEIPSPQQKFQILALNQATQPPLCNAMCQWIHQGKHEQHNETENTGLSFR